VFNYWLLETVEALANIRSIAKIGNYNYADKPAEKHCWLICCERKILFRLKKQAEIDGLNLNLQEGQQTEPFRFGLLFY
jgi:hypothetical protein